MKRDLCTEVSARIVAELEAGTAPWVKSWSASPGANTPRNAVSIGLTQDATSFCCGWRRRPGIAHRAFDPQTVGIEIPSGVNLQLEKT
jgi:hypothetical protein